ncbi:arginase family protein, partial [Clostridioides difficile]|uniref:arginase family protein n=1 Tax=Clostridioides difficile TaxID=1496 RepID=UPI0029C3210A
MKNNFYHMNTFMSMDKNYEESNLIVFGVGFDGTTSNRPGARFASSSMRKEFYGLETYSPFLDLDLEDYNICDYGDLEISVGSTEQVLKEIYQETYKIVRDSKVPFMIGGEHLVTLPAFKAVHEKYNDIYVIHFDAHTDLREEYNNSKNSHATGNLDSKTTEEVMDLLKSSIKKYNQTLIIITHNENIARKAD